MKKQLASVVMAAMVSIAGIAAAGDETGGTLPPPVNCAKLLILIF